jgi:hypothetical protein
MKSIKDTIISGVGYLVRVVYSDRDGEEYNVVGILTGYDDPLTYFFINLNTDEKLTYTKKSKDIKIPVVSVESIERIRGSIKDN